MIDGFMKCLLCQQRNGKRHCPGVRGYICPLCCGQEREVSIECPFECVYLQEAHRYELARAEPATELPYAAHQIPDDFLQEKEPFIGGLAVTLLQSALDTQSMVDTDLRAALDALIRTCETLSSGLFYETLPEGPARVNLYREMQNFVEKWREEELRRTGMTMTRDADVLRSLVFLGRLAQAHDNRRPRGKSFLALLRRLYPQAVARHSQSVVIPG